MNTKICPKCGAKWIENQLYWATGKPGKEEDLAGLVCNKVRDPQCINPKLGDETGQTWEKRLKQSDQFKNRLEEEF